MKTTASYEVWRLSQQRTETGGPNYRIKTGIEPGTDSCNSSFFLLFRVGDDFSFDDAVIEKYGCEVHSFDTRWVFCSWSRLPRKRRLTCRTCRNWVDSISTTKTRGQIVVAHNEPPNQNLPWMQIQLFSFSWYLPSGTQRWNDVILMSMRRDDVASTPIRRHFDVMCLLGYSVNILSVPVMFWGLGWWMDDLRFYVLL